MNDQPSAYQKYRVVGALAAGVVYGLLLRVSFEAKALGAFFQIVSTSFLVVAPFSVGAVAVLAAAGRKYIGFWRQVNIATITMLLFMLAMFLAFLEGLICIVLVAPVFLVASITGGLIAGWINNRFSAAKATLPAFAILPLLLGPLEAGLPPASSEQVVSTSIQIHASPDEVFDQLATVKKIDPDELGFSFVHFIGLPKPIAAEMSGTGSGSVRTSRWQKGVQFQEVITLWDRPKALHYQFKIVAGSIPRAALDRHVEMGGEYFTVIDGGYDLRAMGNEMTELTLTTKFINKSQLQLYGDLWGRMVLIDFHHSILGLMKSRSQAAHANSLQQTADRGG
jgi:hypothetical protein